MSESGLEPAIDELYSTGWAGLDSTGCEHADDGRIFPSVVRVQQEFAQLGYELNIRFVQLFDCYRAEWSDAQGAPAGAVVGASEREAAIYALARLRQKVKAGVKP
ncbi:MAG: hypothetical protein ACF8PN_17045 [Phycisphaerales bacterium]